MARIIVLDAGPLGLASKPRGKAEADRCRQWIYDIAAAGARVVVPEIADYEVRRELLRAGATTGVIRLDQLEAALDYDPITTAAIRRAAALWALVRKAGIPTADKHALDGDCILAAQAELLAGPADLVTIATTNVGHLGRFPKVGARTWESIVPDSPRIEMGRTDWFLGTDLSELINKDVEVIVRHVSPFGKRKHSPPLTCRVFARQDKLWIDFLPEKVRTSVAPLPVDARVYRRDVDEDVTEYGIILEGDNPAIQMVRSILETRGETFE